MARGCSKGFGSRGSTIQSPYLIGVAGHFSCQPVQSPVRVYKSFLLLSECVCWPVGWLCRWCAQDGRCPYHSARNQKSRRHRRLPIFLAM